jgi:hypothetical protein
MYNQRTTQVIAQYGLSWDLIQAALRTFMEFAHDYPELYQLIFQRPVPGFVPSQEGIAEMMKLVGASQDVITRLIAADVIRSGLSAEQTNNLFIALMHGITSLYMANEPDMSPGEGRFGSLIPAAVRLLQSSWGTDREPPASDSKTE